MTEPPLLARALLWVAQLLTPASDRVWVEAMRGDLDVAHARGHALTWAFGCLIAAVRLRVAAVAVLTPRRRQIVVLGCMILLLAGTYAVCFAFGAVRPHGAIGCLIVGAPIVVIVAPLAWFLRHDVPAVITDRWVRRSLLVWIASAALFSVALIVMIANGRFWTTLIAVVSSASPVLVFSAVVGMLATLTTAIVLGSNFSRLPRRIPRMLPNERRFVFFWGATRDTMLALADAGAPEMTLPRGWLINSTLTCTVLLIEAGYLVLQAASSHGLGAGDQRASSLEVVGVAASCLANMLYVIAHVRFARSVPDR
jgi:hypothetical protein